MTRFHPMLQGMRENYRQQCRDRHQDSSDRHHKARKYRGLQNQGAHCLNEYHQERQVQDPASQSIRVKKEPTPVFRPSRIIEIQQNTNVDQYHPGADGNAKDLKNIFTRLDQVWQNFFKTEDTPIDESKECAAESTSDQQSTQSG